MDNRFYFGFNTSEERKKRRKAELYSMSEQVSTFFWDEAPQHGLEMREGQQDMSFEIVDALINDQHFAIEAGVGIGKSFGYLVPVLLYSKRMNKPVIIATSTIALQEQLWRDVHAVMPLLGLNRDVILAKGQTHYLCNKRADEYMCDPKADPPDALKEGIQQGYEERKDFPEVLPQGVWDKVNVQRFSMKNCGSCEKKCKYYKVRAALKYTEGVVLCNQDFLTQHLMKLRRGQDGLINAAADLLVVDEAHNLDDKVRSATTELFGQGMLFGMIKNAFYELRSSDQSSVSGEKREAESAIIAFYNCLKAQVQKQINEAEQDMRYADRFFFDQNGSAVELLTEMNAAIHNLSSSIQIYSSMDFRNNRSFAASDDLDAVSESLSELLDRIDDMLIWIEQRGSNTELVYCPKNTREIVSRLYFNGDERTILTSATLTNATSGSLEEQYSYFISNTGFPVGERGCLSEPKPSPYPYDEHAMIYYCDDLPHPTKEHEAFIEKGVERLLEILNISNGKALVLFTYFGIVFQVVMIVALLQDSINTVNFGLHKINAISIAFFVVYVLLNGCKSITNNMVVPMIADCSDYEQYRSGKFVPGLMGALFSFVDKVFAALGTAFVGLVMLAIGYNSRFPQIEDTLTPVLKWTTIFLFCIVPIIGWVISLLSMHFYSLDMKTMKEIAKKLGDTEGEKKK